MVDTGALTRVVSDEEAQILAGWTALLKSDASVQTGRIREAELHTQAATVLGQLRDALASGVADPAADAFAPLRDTLSDISRSRAIQGFTPSDTANFVLSLKEPVFDALNRAHPGEPAIVAQATWAASKLLDQLSLHTMEVFLASR